MAIWNCQVKWLLIVVTITARLRRLGKAYVDGLYSDDDYRREKRGLEEKLAGLGVPEVDATREAGKLLEELPELWEEADLVERRKILVTMLDAIYVDSPSNRGILLYSMDTFRSIMLNELAVVLR